MVQKSTSWHALEVDEVLTALGTDRHGLTDDEAARRLQQYGRNELGGEEVVSPVGIVLQQVLSPLVYVLFVAAVVSFAVGHLVDTFVILGIVVVNTVIGFLQEYRAEKAMEALRQLAAPKAIVLRDGHQREVAASEIVPGDVVQLAVGDKVPADCRVIGSSNLKADEASLTGESVPVDKSAEPVPADIPLAERTDMVYAGTAMTYGRGRAVVVATGSATEVGRIALSVTAVAKEPTPLQKKLASVGRMLAVIALGLAALILAVGLVRGIGFVDIFLFAVASAVSTIPEGLPAVVTVVLAIGLQRMAARNAIIRQLPAVETLGSATVICTDKTGTLTKNQMTVEVIYAISGEFKVTGEGYAPHGEVLRDGEAVDVSSHRELRLALDAGALCNDADLRCDDSNCTILGDPTEGALVVAAAKAGIVKRDLATQMPRIDEVPFDSDRAYMATLNDSEDRRFIFAKGAPEKLLALCTRAGTGAGDVDLSEDLRSKVLQANRELASRALRVLAIAYKEVSKEQSTISPEDLKEGMVFLALVGMMDPPRPEAIGAIERCKRAGIRVIMATGDHRITARAIAEQMGILRGHDGVIEGKELDRMSDEMIENRIDEIDVFARVEPQHKFRIVTALKRRGHIVAMTGDGVNDAPALKRADIGIAMGITGTDVAKEASKMVLADDNFVSIVGAVEEGRIVFQNIRKVVTYLLSTNAGEVLAIMAILLLGLPLPFLPVQILWINLVTDSFPALALAADPPREDVLAEPPRDPNAPIISRVVLIRILLVALVMAAGTLAVFYGWLGSTGLTRARTMAFAVMAIFQLFNVLNVRSPKLSAFSMSPFSNRWLVLALLVCSALQVAAIHLPFMQTLFRTVDLTVSEWGIVMLVSSMVLWVEEIRKRVAARPAE